jgi:RNA polymerase sigma-70 factor (ECF subfamily)
MDHSKLSAQELVQLCLESGDEAAWAEFVRRFHPLIAGVVIKRVRRRINPVPSVIDDLVQDTYLKLCTNNFKALREFDFQHENALFGFLKVIAANVVEDHFRGSHSQKRGSGREEEDLETVSATIPASTGFSDEVEREILMGEIKQCLETQSAEPNSVRDCAIFWLYYRQGLTAKAISQLPAVGLTVKGVESTLFRLTRLVKAMLTEKPPQRRTSGR